MGREPHAELNLDAIERRADDESFGCVLTYDGHERGEPDEYTCHLSEYVDALRADLRALVAEVRRYRAAVQADVDMVARLLRGADGRGTP